MAGTKLPKGQIAKWRGEIPIESLYTAGIGGQRFFKALKEKGELVGTRCRPCNQVFLPSRQFCERCFAELTEEVQVQPDGVVKSFSYAYVDHERQTSQATCGLGARAVRRRHDSDATQTARC